MRRHPISRRNVVAKGGPSRRSAVQRIAGVPMARRVRTSNDLGEIMVFAHAAVAADAGANVTVLIDDGSGQRLAAKQQSRLKKLRASGRPVGKLLVIDTVTALQRAAGGEHLPDRAAMRDLYKRMRGLDDGLVPIGETGLLKPPCWDRHPARLA